MKKLFYLFTLSIVFLLTSCKGDQGPPGPQGGLVYANVFEITVGDYNYDNTKNQLFSDTYSFPITVYESDVLLAFHYEGQSNIGNNESADVWTPLPQNVFYTDGTGDFFQYNFNHTFVDLQFTIEGNFPLNTIANAQRTNQIFRIAVVPSEFANKNPSMDDILEVMKASEHAVKKLH